MNTIAAKRESMRDSLKVRRNSGGGFLDIMTSPSPGKLDDTDEEELADQPSGN